MKRYLLLLSCCYAFTSYDVLSASPSCLQTKEGVIVFTNPACTGTFNIVTLEMISDNIISVNTVPGKEMAPAQSLVTGYTQRPDFSWKKMLFPSFPILYNQATETVTVDDRKGGYNGMLQKRTFRINLIKHDKTRRLDMDTYDKKICMMVRK